MKTLAGQRLATCRWAEPTSSPCTEFRGWARLYIGSDFLPAQCLPFYLYLTNSKLQTTCKYVDQPFYMTRQPFRPFYVTTVESSRFVHSYQYEKGSCIITWVSYTIYTCCLILNDDIWRYMIWQCRRGWSNYAESDTYQFVVTLQC